jgi:hypothetical protein
VPDVAEHDVKRGVEAGLNAHVAVRERTERLVDEGEPASLK